MRIGYDTGEEHDEAIWGILAGVKGTSEVM